MFWYMLLFALLAPLIGIWQVENGHLAWSIGVMGYPNGASLMYIQYLLMMLAAFFAARGVMTFLPRKHVTMGQMAGQTAGAATSSGNLMFDIFARRLLAIGLIYAVIFLFGFGSIKVVLGIQGKGEFRASLGQLGFLAFLYTKTIIPMLLCALVILYRQTGKSKYQKKLLVINITVAFLTAMTWGFKTTGIAILLPAGIIILWNANMFTMTKYFVYVLAVLLGAFYAFDSGSGVSLSGAFEFLFIRATVLQGDVSWWVWDIYSTGGDFPPYWGSLFAVLGDKVLRMTGITGDNMYEWMLFHYDWMINYVAGVSLDRTAGGHSIVGTPFSEGLIMGGVAGVTAIAVFAGALVAMVYTGIRTAIRTGNTLKGAVLSTFFTFNVFSWLSAGGVTQMFHISVVVGFAISYFLTRALIPRPAQISPPRPAWVLPTAQPAE